MFTIRVGSRMLVALIPPATTTVVFKLFACLRSNVVELDSHVDAQAEGTHVECRTEYAPPTDV